MASWTRRHCKFAQAQGEMQLPDKRSVADMAWDYISEEEQYQVDYQMQHGTPSPNGVDRAELDADKQALMAAENANDAATIQQIMEKYKAIDEAARKPMPQYPIAYKPGDGLRPLASWVGSNCKFAMDLSGMEGIDLTRTERAPGYDVMRRSRDLMDQPKRPRRQIDPFPGAGPSQQPPQGQPQPSSGQIVVPGAKFAPSRFDSPAWDGDNEGTHSSGWTIKALNRHLPGDLYEDHFTAFEAEHPQLGRVWGDINDDIMATTEEGLKHFFQHHPIDTDTRDV